MRAPSLQRARRYLGAVFVAASFGVGAPAEGQGTASADSSGAAMPPAKPVVLLQGRDLVPVSLVLAGTAAAMPFDRRMTLELAEPEHHRSSLLRGGASAFNAVGSPGVAVASVMMWGGGALLRRPQLAGDGMHALVAIGTSALVTSGLKIVIGRSRPFASADDAFRFGFLRGREQGRTSLPSGHTTAAFAFASSLAADLRQDHPRAARWSVPLLYAGAASVGAARVYTNRHWLSDVVLGGGIGGLIGHRTTTWMRARRLGVRGAASERLSISPIPAGVAATWTFGSR